MTAESTASGGGKFDRIVIGEYADYLDTGIWDMGRIVSTADLTMSQLKDFLKVSGGGVYLRADGRFEWLQIERKGGE